jgi:hypothetical protein
MKVQNKTIDKKRPRVEAYKTSLVQTPTRRAGNTTRLVDECIQLLFSGVVCVCHDHWENGNNRHANQNLFERVMKRLNYEHGWVSVVCDTRKFEIALDYEGSK